MKKLAKENAPDKVKKRNRQIWFLLSRTYHLQLRQFGLFLKKWGLTVAQYEVLKRIAEQERISQKDLAEKLFVSKGNVTQLITKMENLGYIHRDQEWKTKYLSLTEKGLTLYKNLLPEEESYFTLRFEGLTKKEQKELVKLLQKIYDEELNFEK
ncbi:MarR family transcriptional regulator [Sporolactobacillus shoreae]|uniref:MarR family transcriptional regulator n=1 Tax=Sporolactobacillus shoreae TaxID=1465501 RepID=A0A4Z0GLY5_9BACL|nr:MarR family transcriptional regulator [Sporolactobacillus shoreae]TGA97065.1 MarR family transcriptional regulator [Sporolactobacillus shoreae]